MSSSAAALIVLLLAAISTRCHAFSQGYPGTGHQLNLPVARAHPTDADADAVDEGAITDRRALLHSVVAAGTALGISALSPNAAIAAGAGAESFVASYSDPINHPGGTRTIKLVDGAKVGDYQLAQVFGGGGRGEPKEYVLPAVIVGDRSILIDFSPKGGPRDFAGVLDGDGSIKFIRDGNRWPRL
ncbi:hypothetical protein ACHAXT_011594 [Thalassiosira profunda]